MEITEDDLFPIFWGSNKDEYSILIKEQLTCTIIGFESNNTILHTPVVLKRKDHPTIEDSSLSPPIVKKGKGVMFGSQEIGLVQNHDIYLLED